MVQLPAQPESPSRVTGPPPPSSPMPRVAGALAGETHADNLRHAYLRVHFMNALLTDPRVAGQFDEWGQQIGLYAAADAVAQSSQQFAEAMGAPHWTAITKRSNETDGQPFAAVATRLTALAEANVSAPAMPSLKSFCVEVENFVLFVEKHKPMELSPAEFVQATLGLQWSWLAYELVDSFFRYVQARAFGVVETRTYTVVSKGPLAPPLTWAVNFETSAGETVHEAADRFLDAATKAFRDRLEVARALDNAKSNARGRRPKSDTRYLQDWAQWFYRIRVKQPPESERSIAIQVDRGRRTIRNAVRSAERLLGLGQYTLRK